MLTWIDLLWLKKHWIKLLVAGHFGVNSRTENDCFDMADALADKSTSVASGLKSGRVRGLRVNC
jgi:hypothetical protein